MRYCPKCRALCEDDTAVRCPECGARRLRAPQPDDMVLLVTVIESEAENIRSALETSGLKFSERPTGIDGIPSMYSSDAILSNKNFYVPYTKLGYAESLVKEVRRCNPPPKPSNSESAQSEKAQMPRGKRILIQAVSFLLFMFAIWLVVNGTDWLAQSIQQWMSGLR